MHGGLRYRGYVIYYDGTQLVAEELNPADTTVFEMGSSSIEPLIAAIDELWSYLDAVKSLKAPVPAPSWFQAWIEAGCGERIQLRETSSSAAEQQGQE